MSDTNKVSGDQIRLHCTLTSELRSYGSKVPKSKKEVANSAHAVMAMINKAKGLAKNGTQAKIGLSKERKPHKDYGSHQGNKHVYDIVDAIYESPSDIPDTVVLSIANAMTALQCYEGSIDVKAMKNQCESKDAALDVEFKERYGTSLTEEQALALRRAKSKNAFQYWTCEIKVEAIADHPIEGFQLQEDGLYHNYVRSKRIYTSSMVPLTWIMAHAIVDETCTKLVRGFMDTIRIQPQVFVEIPDSGRPRFVSVKTEAKRLAGGYSPGN